MRLRRAIWLVLAALLVPASAHAQAVSFGADLNRPANNGFATCFNGYDEGSFYHFVPAQNTCTWAGVGGLGNTSESHVAPATGVITNVRVKVGPTTGPMQFTLLRYYRRDNPAEPGRPDLRGPFFQGETGAFTPAANATTSVPVNLPVRSDFDPNLNAYVFDALGLTVLAPNVPIPAHDTGDRSGSFLAAAWFPRVSPADQANGRVDGHSPAGVVPLYNAIMACGGGAAVRAAQCGVAGGGAGGNLMLSPSLALRRSSAEVQRGIARLRLACQLSMTCLGTVRLTRRAGAAAKVTYANGRFRIKPGATKTVKAKLTKSGKRLMRKRKRAKVRLVATMGKGQAKRVFRANLTLKR
jgi:hypothetical protein